MTIFTHPADRAPLRCAECEDGYVDVLVQPKYGAAYDKRETCSNELCDGGVQLCCVCRNTWARYVAEDGEPVCLEHSRGR